MKMSVSLSLFSFFLLVIHNACAFNITQILNQYPDYSTFNSYLTQTNLAGEINSRQTVTVLAVENSNLSPLSGKPLEIVKRILSVHVILDYFDVQKLQKISSHTAIVTTLFQTTGLARGQQGFINVTHASTDGIAFGSAVPGSTIGSNLVKSIASQPYNISVLQVSNVIVPQGIDGSSTSPPPSRTPSASPPVARSPPAPPPKSSRAPAPSRAPRRAKAPAEAVTPAATPGSSPIPDAPAADKDDSPGAATALDIGLAVVFSTVLSTLHLASRI